MAGIELEPEGGEGEDQECECFQSDPEFTKRALSTSPQKRVPVQVEIVIVGLLALQERSTLWSEMMEWQIPSAREFQPWRAVRAQRTRRIGCANIALQALQSDPLHNLI